jgi:hypothetical protein
MNKIRRCVLGFSSVVAFALFATVGFAAGPSDAEKRASCGGDVMRLCFSSIGSDAAIEGCLRAHLLALSPVRALLVRIPLGPGPSLHRLRCDSPLCAGLSSFCSPASQLLWRGPTPRVRSSLATASHLPDADH